MLEFLETGPVWLVAVVSVGMAVGVVYVLPFVARWIWNLGRTVEDWEDE